MDTDNRVLQGDAFIENESNKARSIYGICKCFKPPGIDQTNWQTPADGHCRDCCRLPDLGSTAGRISLLLKWAVEALLVLLFFCAFGVQWALMQIMLALQRVAAQPVGQALWRLLKPSFSDDDHLSLIGLLDHRVKKQYISILSTIIVVSGLLTTSTYQALYTGYVPPGQVGSDPNRYVTIPLLENDRLLQQMMVFRLANLLSFIMSLVCIVCCTIITLWLNKYALRSSDDTPPELANWAAALVYTSHVVAFSAFYISLMCAFFAAILAAMAFLSTEWAVCVGFAITIFAVALILLASVTTGVYKTENRGLLLEFDKQKPMGNVATGNPDSDVEIGGTVSVLDLPVVPPLGPRRRDASIT